MTRLNVTYPPLPVDPLAVRPPPAMPVPGDADGDRIAEVDPYVLGVQNLVDTLLLSKVAYLVKHASEHAEFALYINPALHDNSYDFDIWDADTIRPKWWDDSAVPQPLPSFFDTWTKTLGNPVPTFYEPGAGPPRFFPPKPLGERELAKMARQPFVPRKRTPLLPRRISTRSWEGLPDVPTQGGRVLYVIMGQLRGSHLAWNSVVDNVLRPNKADVALCVGEIEPEQLKAFPYPVKFVFQAGEPANGDFTNMTYDLANVEGLNVSRVSQYAMKDNGIFGGIQVSRDGSSTGTCSLKCY